MRHQQTQVCDPSRRRFLGLLAGLGVGALESPRLSAGRQTSPAIEKRQLIDFHHHFFPPAFVAGELKRLYYEIANSANRPAMAALTSLVPMSQILFGTDYPFVPIDVTADGMETLGFSAKDLRSMGWDNGLALLPLLKR